MDVKKELDGGAASAAEDLERINALAKTPLTAEQVYTFAVRLCDNEVDRDFERFDEAALSALGDLFLGKSGMFDHQWSALGQTARIYKTEVVREPERSTAAGDGYCYLKAWAYLLRSEKNAELIAEIEGGIKKEVSVGCSMGRSVCSICGGESGQCEHTKGQRYGGKLCYAELREPLDAYEWSFVAVPAQREAGVLKKTFAGPEDGALRRLRAEAQMGRSYLKALRREVVRLAMLADEGLDGTVLSAAVEKLEERELLELKGGYERRVARKFPPAPQLGGRRAPERETEGESAFVV